MAIACLAAVWVAVPFLWAIDNSLKTNADIFRPGAVIPFLQFTPRLDIWKTVLDDPQVLNCLFSSALVGLSTTVLVLLIGTPAAYSLARFEFGRVESRDITLWFLSQRVLPPVVVIALLHPARRVWHAGYLARTHPALFHVQLESLRGHHARHLS